MKDYPDLDCVVLNSGVTSGYKLNQPDKIDLDAFDREVDTNFTSIMHLSIKFLPHLLAKDYPTCMMYTGSQVSMIPASNIAAYSASKAAMGAYFECLRRQNQGSSVKFIEILPAAVQSKFCWCFSCQQEKLSQNRLTNLPLIKILLAELNDFMGPQGRYIGMSIDEFTDEVFKGLADGLEQIPVGVIGGAEADVYKNFLGTRNALFKGLNDLIMAYF